VQPTLGRVRDMSGPRGLTALRVITHESCARAMPATRFCNVTCVCERTYDESHYRTLFANPMRANGIDEHARATQVKNPTPACWHDTCTTVRQTHEPGTPKETT